MNKRKRKVQKWSDESDEDDSEVECVTDSVTEFQFSKEKFSVGSFSEIFKCSRNGEKLVKKQFKSTNTLQNIRNEISILKRLQNGCNIIRLVAVIKDPSDIYPAIIFEELPIVFAEVYMSLTSFDARFYLWELLKALQHCHNNELIHRDIKPENVVIDERKRILRLIDFGVAVHKPTAEHRLSGTLHYMAPELLVGSNNLYYQSDIWAFGCILAEAIFKKKLFKGFNQRLQLGEITKLLGSPPMGTDDLKIYLNTHGINFNIFEDKKPKLKQFLAKNSENTSPNALDLIEKIFVYDPLHRLSTNQIMEHGYFCHPQQQEPSSAIGAKSTTTLKPRQEKQLSSRTKTPINNNLNFIF